jgi:uncharacterized protein YqeY
MIWDDLNRELKEAMKARDAIRIGALRMAIAAAKEKRIELKRDLTDSDLLGVLAGQVKKRKESIEQFLKGGRQDLADREQKESEILQAFLPEALTEEALDAAIDAAIQETGATSKRDLGKVMKAVMAKYKGQVDGKAVNRKVAEKLA